MLRAAGRSPVIERPNDMRCSCTSAPGYSLRCKIGTPGRDSIGRRGMRESTSHILRQRIPRSVIAA
jgi:hypothetical protein